MQFKFMAVAQPPLSEITGIHSGFNDAEGNHLVWFSLTNGRFVPGIPLTPSCTAVMVQAPGEVLMMIPLAFAPAGCNVCSFSEAEIPEVTDSCFNEFFNDFFPKFDFKFLFEEQN